MMVVKGHEIWPKTRGYSLVIVAREQSENSQQMLAYLVIAINMLMTSIL